jgi:hypothetical protein
VFFKTVRLLRGTAARKAVKNPRVAVFLDCLPEAQGLPKELRDGFMHVVAKAKFQASHWEGVSDEFSLPGGGGDGSLAPVARMLGKLWPQKGPDWVMCIRQHAMEKAQMTQMQWRALLSQEWERRRQARRRQGKRAPLATAMW